MNLRFLLFFLLLYIQCKHNDFIEEEILLPKERIDILALGDSYTIGQGVFYNQNYPNQLSDSLSSHNFNVIGTRIIAKTGWRTDNLLNSIDNAIDIQDSAFSLVMLLIGVNNQYQNSSFNTYEIQFEELLIKAIKLAGNRKERVIVLSIPDYAFTPFGQNYSNPNDISMDIDEYNVANMAISLGYGVRYIDVTAISRDGLDLPSFVAPDGLHPSALQYTEWLKLILPQVIDIF
jgi:acyl-CoA thioesterase I